MKILILSANYPNPNNLVEGIFIKEQAHALSIDNEVTAFIFKNESEKFSIIPKISLKKTYEEKLCIYHFNISKSLPVLNQFIYLISSLLTLLIVTNKQKYEITHCHYTYPAGLPGLFLKKFKKIPYLITEHSGVFEHHFRSRIHKYLTLLAFRHADGIISVSKKAADKLKKYTSKEIKIIYNFFDESKFCPGNIIREDNSFHIGFAGNFNNNNKGLDLLLKALSVCTFDFQLYIAGDGPLKESYVVLAKELNIIDKCHFMGQINPNQLPSFYHDLDLFVLCSRNESFGIVLIEALACGIPAIATKCGGPEEIMSSVCGLLIENNNSESLYQALKQMHQDISAYDRHCIRTYALDHFGKAQFIKRVSQYFNDLLLLK